MSLWLDESKIKDAKDAKEHFSFLPPLSRPGVQLLDVCAVICCALFNSVS